MTYLTPDACSRLRMVFSIALCIGGFLAFEDGIETVGKYVAGISWALFMLTFAVEQR